MSEGLEGWGLSLREWAPTLAARVKRVLGERHAVGVLHQGFTVKLGVCRTIFACLCGIDRSHVPLSGLSSFWSAALRAVWSSRVLLTHLGSVLCFCDGPMGADPAFHFVWSRIPQLLWFLAYVLTHTLDGGTEVCIGHGLVHLLCPSAAE